LSFTVLGIPLICTSKNGSAQKIAGVSLILAPWAGMTIFYTLQLVALIFQCAYTAIYCCVVLGRWCKRSFDGDSRSVSLYTENFPVSYPPATYLQRSAQQWSLDAMQQHQQQQQWQQRRQQQQQVQQMQHQQYQQWRSYHKR
jgi:hypothetical protein